LVVQNGGFAIVRFEEDGLSNLVMRRKRWQTRGLFVCLLVGCVQLGFASFAQGASWVCTQADGTQLYSDRELSLSCRKVGALPPWIKRSHVRQMGQAMQAKRTILRDRDEELRIPKLPASLMWSNSVRMCNKGEDTSSSVCLITIRKYPTSVTECWRSNPQNNRKRLTMNLEPQVRKSYG